MKTTISTLLFSLLALVSAFGQDLTFKTKFDNAIPVLNVGTFHMGETTDANKTEFDEHDPQNKKQVHQIAAMLAKFRPTVIIVEIEPAYQDSLESQYQRYLKNPAMQFKNPDEVELLAFEVGRLSGASRIHAIDYKEGYNYMISRTVADESGKLLVRKYEEMMQANEQAFYQQKNNAPTVLDMLQGINHPDYLDYLINTNADMLTYISSKGKSEGADEAAKFYHRNLVMYSNLNQIPLSADDRVFILMGASHTAFFKELMKRSPKYKLVDVQEYLK